MTVNATKISTPEKLTAAGSIDSNAIINSVESNANSSDATTINVLHRRLKQDGCHVYWLKGNQTHSSYAHILTTH